MQGHGAIEGDQERNVGRGSLKRLVHDPLTAVRYGHLMGPDHGWTVRDDVHIRYLDRSGPLTAGFGAKESLIGPELQFGHVAGDAIDAPVLLIKVAWGGKSLAVDFRPPSSGGTTGPFYAELLEQVRTTLADLPAFVPGYAGEGYELCGFGWHQGWNDRVNQAFNDEYETNLAHFIRDIRRDLGEAQLPFVIAETGMAGPGETHPRALSLMAAQAAVAAYPEFQGNVGFVGTRDFYRGPEDSPSNQAYHWNRNAETYLLIGGAMANSMLSLIGE